LWEFLRDAADSKPLHTGKAAANGLIAAYLARDGFTGAKQILEGRQGLAAGMSTDADPSRLTNRLGTRWTLAETSFKFHASCRHTHPAADALLMAMRDNDLSMADIGSVTTLVHQGAIDVLGPVISPTTVHQAKFSMGTTLGLIAAYGRAGMNEFEEGFARPDVTAFRDRVRMQLDDEVNSAYPARWIGKVQVETVDGRKFEARVDEPKGDPGNTLSRDEIDAKVRGLAAFSGAANTGEMDTALPRLWQIDRANSVETLFAAAASSRGS
jgi:2-methylcitrate dehydratase PrpD